MSLSGGAFVCQIFSHLKVRVLVGGEGESRPGGDHCESEEEDERTPIPFAVLL